MASLIFAERFWQLLEDRANTFQKLESAYHDLEETSALKQLGESTAIINHEIKNYMFMISGNAQILQEFETLSEKGKGMVNNIVTSVERLTLFSQDILELSKTHIIKDNTPIDICVTIKKTIDDHFHKMKEHFILSGFEKEQFIYADWSKLEQVFVNIFKNCFEAASAESPLIKVRLEPGPSVLLVAIEDNGVGCNEDQIDNLFKAFFTTKKGKGGTGLGMSITRTIIESHGGKISAYSKNLGKNGDHGLKMNITFPIYATDMSRHLDRKFPIVLIKEGIEDIASVIRVFQNVSVIPHVLQNVDELEVKRFSPETMAIVASSAILTGNHAKLAFYKRLFLISSHKKHLYILDSSAPDEPEIFSEDYVLSRLLEGGWDLDPDGLILLKGRKELLNT